MESLDYKYATIRERVNIMNKKVHPILTIILSISLVFCMTAWIVFTMIPANSWATNNAENDYGVSGEDYKPGNVIVCVEDGAGVLVGDPDSENVEGENGTVEGQKFTVEKELTELDGGQEIALIEGADTEKLIKALEDKSYVKYAQPDYYCESLGTGGMEEPFFGYQWGLDMSGENDSEIDADMNVKEAWQNMNRTESTGQKPSGEPVVAILDTGVDHEHPELAKRMWKDGKKYPELKELGGGKYGINTIKGENTKDTMDFTGHGTHCAAIAAAQWSGQGIAGVTNNIRIMACKWMNAEGKLSDLVEAYDYIIEAKKCGVNVCAVNNSWGIAGGPYDVVLPAVDDVVNRASEEGIVSCFAAGNSCIDHDGHKGYDYPTKDNVLIVGASDCNGNAAFFSDYGKETVDVFAPGCNILSAFTEKSDNDNNIEYYPWLVDNNIVYENFENTQSQIQLTEIALKYSDEDGWTGERTNNKASIVQAIAADIHNNHAAALKFNDTGDEKLDEFKYAEFTITDNRIKKAADENEDLYVGMRLKYNRIIKEGIPTEVLIKSQDNGEYEYIGGYDINEGQWGFQSASIPKEKIKKYVDSDGSINLVVGVLYENSGKFRTDPELIIDDIGIGTREQIIPYRYMSGTSQACPAVAGLTGAVYAKICSSKEGKKLSPKEKAAITRAYVMGSADRNSSLAEKCISGGIVKADAALSLDSDLMNPVLTGADWNGDNLQIRGYFFGDNKGEVYIDGNKAEIVSWSDKCLTVSAGEAVGSYEQMSVFRVIRSDERWGKHAFTLNRGKTKGYKNLTPPDKINNAACLGAANGTVIMAAFTDKDTCLEMSKYDVDSDRWSPLEPPEEGIDPEHLNIEAKMAGGKDEIYFLYRKLDDSRLKLATYNTVTNSWNKPIRLSKDIFIGASIGVYKGKLILVGGDDPGNEKIDYTSVRLIYPDTGKIYGEMPSLKGKYFYPQVCISGDDIYILGAFALDNASASDIDGKYGKRRPIAYLQGDTWKEGEQIFTDTEGYSPYIDKDVSDLFAAVALKDGIMMTGPVKNNYMPEMIDTWEYSKTADRWTGRQDFRFDVCRTLCIEATELDGIMYVLGTSGAERANGGMLFRSMKLGDKAPVLPENAEKSSKPAA